MGLGVRVVVRVRARAALQHLARGEQDGGLAVEPERAVVGLRVDTELPQPLDRRLARVRVRVTVRVRVRARVRVRGRVRARVWVRGLGEGGMAAGSGED